MADFPPNPEDGELWLPSYIIREISSTAPPPPKSAPKSKVVLPRNNPPPSRSSFQICFGSFGATNVPVANKPAPEISFHKPITPSATLQGFEGRKSKAVIEKYGGTGTGVFIPRSLHIVGGKKLPEELSGGTGVFLNHQVAITCQQRKKTNGKEEEALESSNKQKRCSIMKEQETYQYASGICLPKDWTY
ncbi:hypothetical protein OWV82_008366 [Melia azedarach]|uniref:Uncharacterized protein n=1 Tax=Melia azedarach TaxID=155640 RepID=A0ACC1YAT7_MELAZ|nr:hypothetical protein OWV82_008366 [Melia azedarach]